MHKVQRNVKNRMKRMERMAAARKAGKSLKQICQKENIVLATYYKTFKDFYSPVPKPEYKESGRGFRREHIARAVAMRQENPPVKWREICERIGVDSSEGSWQEFYSWCHYKLRKEGRWPIGKGKVNEARV